MRTRWLLLTAALLSVALVVATAACGGGSDDDPADPAATPTGGPMRDGEIDVRLFEWTLDVSVTSAPAGTITFNARNVGGANHDLVIVRTDLDPNDLPVGEDGYVDVADPRLEVAGKIDVFEPGLNRSAEFTLEPGTYALICNIVDVAETGTTSHYVQGMRTAFQVTE